MATLELSPWLILICHPVPRSRSRRCRQALFRVHGNASFHVEIASATLHAEKSQHTAHIKMNFNRWYRECGTKRGIVLFRVFNLERRIVEGRNIWKKSGAQVAASMNTLYSQDAQLT